MSRTFNQQQGLPSRLPPGSRFGKTIRQVRPSLTNNYVLVLVVTTVGQGKRLLLRFNNTWSVQNNTATLRVKYSQRVSFMSRILNVCRHRALWFNLLLKQPQLHVQHHGSCRRRGQAANQQSGIANDPASDSCRCSELPAGPHTTAAETSLVTFAHRLARLDGLGVPTSLVILQAWTAD